MFNIYEIEKDLILNGLSKKLLNNFDYKKNAYMIESLYDFYLKKNNIVYKEFRDGMKINENIMYVNELKKKELKKFSKDLFGNLPNNELSYKLFLLSFFFLVKFSIIVGKTKEKIFFDFINKSVRKEIYPRIKKVYGEEYYFLNKNDIKFENVSPEPIGFFVIGIKGNKKKIIFDYKKTDKKIRTTNKIDKNVKLDIISLDKFIQLISNPRYKTDMMNILLSIFVYYVYLEYTKGNINVNLKKSEVYSFVEEFLGLKYVDSKYIDIILFRKNNKFLPSLDLVNSLFANLLLNIKNIDLL